MYKPSERAIVLRMAVMAVLSTMLCAMSLFPTAAVADDAVSALIRRQTDASSDAGQRGDQATVNRFLDDAVLFSAGDGNVQRDPKFDGNDAVSALLEQQTQAFRDARERGDRAAMRGYLDRKVLFVDEDGVVSLWRDVPGGVSAGLTRATSSSVTVTDWVLHHSGNVAVSSFTDDEVVRFGGQTLNCKFLSVDTWIKRGAVWKLIGSQTIPLHQDPPVAALSPDQLAEYVGVYSAGQGSAVIISRDGDALTSTTNGAKPVSLQAEFRDIFFVPGFPPGYARPRSIFQRDPNGHLIGYVRGGTVYARRETAAPQSEPVAASTPPLGPLKLRNFVVHHSGDVAVATFLHDRDTPYYGQVLHQTYRSIETWIKRGAAWKMIASQGRQMLPDAPTVILSPRELDGYIGTYADGSGRTVTLSRYGNGLAAAVYGEQRVLLVAEVRDVFFTPGLPRTTIAFQRDGSGRVTEYVSRRDERDLKFSKI